MGGNIIEFEALRVLREGERRGNHKALSQVALDMIHDGYSGKEIMKIARKSRQEIDELAKDNGLNVIWKDEEVAIN